MKFNETPAQAEARIKREAKAAAAPKETKPRGESKVIKTLAEGAKVLPSEDSKRTVPFINKDTMEWSLATAMTKRFENAVEFSKADASKILAALGDVYQEAAEIAFNSGSGLDISAFNGKAMKFRFNAEEEAHDAVLLQAIKAAKDAAKARGVAEDDLDTDPAVAESLTAFRESSVMRVANVSVKYSQTMIDKEGQLVKKVN